tara:strand:- start:62030 stop:62572 length:543 start_codon:yes stop_codon:yes gene_type:complete
MNTVIWGVTGRPGTGKTKVINTLHYRLLSNNISMGGVLTRDIKEHGKRTGIEIQNISTGISYEIANVNRKTGPRLQKFRINLENIDNYLIKELENSSSKADLIIIDMIGPMELFSTKFCELTSKLLEQDKKILCAIQTKYNHPIIKEIKKMRNVKLYDLNEKHKVEVIDDIYNNIIEKIE